MSHRSRAPRWIRILSVPLLIIVSLSGWWAVTQYRYQIARENWKTATLPHLVETSATNEQVRIELEQIKNPTSNVDFSWAHEHVILMTNGEYLVYAFRHGFNNGFLDHLFLAHGTDGKWYYSTYHFCNHMAVILADDPPGSIGEFAKRYWLSEFDGKSDDCLKHTWPAKR